MLISSIVSSRIPGNSLSLSWIRFSGFFKMTCKFSLIPFRWHEIKVQAVWKIRANVSHQLPEPMEVNAQLRDQRWKETSECCTVAWICDGFYCEGMSLLLHPITLEALLELSPPHLSPSGVQIPGFCSHVWQKALMVMRQMRESLQSYWLACDLSLPQIIFS